MSARKMHPEPRVAEYRARGWWTDETVQGLFADRVAEFGDELAVSDPPNKSTLVDLAAQRLTWNEVDVQADRLAAALLSNGVGEGDVVAIQLPNIVELVVAYLAVWKVRAIASPLPVQYRRHEIVELGNLAGVRVILTCDRIGERQAAAEAVGLQSAIGGLAKVLYFGPAVVAGAVSVATHERLAYDADVADLRRYERDHPVDPNDCITICWTSGTESRPKGVPRAHYEWLCMSWDTVQAPNLTHESRVLSPFPIVNMAGISGVLLPWLRVGNLLVQHHPFDLQVFLGQIEDERISYTLAPPALLASLLRQEDLLGQADISSIRQIGSGSAPLQEWMVQGWHDRFGVTVINFFGSNEGVALMTDVARMPDPAQRARFFPRYGDGRRWSFPASERTTVRLVDPATGEEIEGPGRPGELRLKGPSVFAGYLDGENLTSPFDEDGFLKTGDVFEIDGPNDEFLRYVDRVKDIIIRGGMNIAPAELETLLAAHPDIVEVAVVGYPDDLLGERVAAVVVPRPGVTPTLADVVGFLRRQEIASYKLPERLEVLEALPRNPVGKVLKRQLRDRVGGPGAGTLD